MRRMVCSGLLLMIIALGILLPAQAQEKIPVIAAVHEGNVWLYGDGDPRPITTDPTAAYTDLTWNPAGTQLAFIQIGETPSLVVYDLTTQALTTLAGDLTLSGFPISYTSDGTQIVYAVENWEVPLEGTSPDGLMLVQTDVYSVEPVAGVSSERLASFAVGAGCGGGVGLPDEARYFQETGGFMGNTAVFSLTPFGLVHNSSCLGVGVALYDLTAQEDVLLDVQLSQVVVSPDRTRLLGVKDNTLTLIDLQTQMLTPLATTGTPEQVAWGAPGTDDVFYSTVTPLDRQIELTEQEAQEIMAILGFGDPAQFLLYEVSIHRLNIAAAIDTEIYRQEAYAVGRMMAVPDGSGLVFSIVPNIDGWIRALLDGTLDTSNFSEVFKALKVDLYWLNFADNTPALIDSDLNLAAVSPAGN